jgi:uncharacterized lipoprotein
MAYLREEKENLEVSHPMNAIWETIPKVIAKLEWKVQETNEGAHRLRVKTKGAFMSYPSTLSIDLVEVTDETTRVSIKAETPVTTITSTVDFGRTRERIEQFVATLAKLMSS